jgi:bifunctional non-homologous end joining protein LigD
VTLDSQGVACGTGDVTDFEPLNVALGGPAKREVFRYAFDLVELDGRDMRREPWSDRRSKLARLLRGSDHGVRLSDHVEGNDGEAMFRRACLVKPRRRRREAAGQALWVGGSPDWIKVKNPDATAATRLIERLEGRIACSKTLSTTLIAGTGALKRRVS